MIGGRGQSPMREIKIGYSDLATSSIIRAMERRWAALKVKFDPALFDLPDMGHRRSRRIGRSPSSGR